jgi:hypothetical protein
VKGWLTINSKRLVALDPERKSNRAAQFEAELRARVVGLRGFVLFQCGNKTLGT